MTAQALLLEAVPSLEKNRDLLVEMLMRPDDVTIASLGRSVRVFLERNGVDITLDPLRMKVMAQELPPSLRQHTKRGRLVQLPASPSPFPVVMLTAIFYHERG